MCAPSVDFVRDPGPVWTRLRADGPVHRLATPDGPSAWFVVGFDGVHACLLDRRLSLEKRDAAGGDYTGFSLPPALHAHLLNSEPPAHTRLRELVAPAMHPRRIEVFEPRLQAAPAPRARDTLGTMLKIVEDLIDSAAPEGGKGLLPLLVAARAAGRLSDDELTSMVFHLLFVW